MRHTAHSRLLVHARQSLRPLAPHCCPTMRALSFERYVYSHALIHACAYTVSVHHVGCSIRPCVTRWAVAPGAHSSRRCCDPTSCGTPRSAACQGRRCRAGTAPRTSRCGSFKRTNVEEVDVGALPPVRKLKPVAFCTSAGCHCAMFVVKVKELPCRTSHCIRLLALRPAHAHTHAHAG